MTAKAVPIFLNLRLRILLDLLPIRPTNIAALFPVLKNCDSCCGKALSLHAKPRLPMHQVGVWRLKTCKTLAVT